MRPRLAIAAVFFVACSGPGVRPEAVTTTTPPPPPVERDRIVLAVAAPGPLSLDPLAVSPDLEQLVPLQYLFFGAGSRGWDAESGEWLPGLVDVEFVDGDRVTLRIREGAEWTDGTSVTGFDLAHTVRTLQAAERSDLAARARSIDATSLQPGPDFLSFRHDGRFDPADLFPLILPSGSEGVDLGRTAGPYRVGSFRDGRVVVLDSRSGGPQIVIRWYRDAEAALEAMRRGAVDAVTGVGLGDELPGTRLIEVNSGQRWVLWFDGTPSRSQALVGYAPYRQAVASIATAGLALDRGLVGGDPDPWLGERDTAALLDDAASLTPVDPRGGDALLVLGIAEDDPEAERVAAEVAEWLAVDGIRTVIEPGMTATADAVVTRLPEAPSQALRSLFERGGPLALPNAPPELPKSTDRAEAALAASVPAAPLGPTTPYGLIVDDDRVAGMRTSYGFDPLLDVEFWSLP